MRHIGDDQRRARIARRHGLHQDHRFTDPVAATRGMTALHATEPSTVHLSLQARVDGLAIADVDAALYDSRELVKQLAMRRTLFVFTRELLPAAWGSAAAGWPAPNSAGSRRTWRRPVSPPTARAG